MKMSKRSLSVFALVTAIVAWSQTALAQVREAGFTYAPLGPGVYLSLECEVSRVIGFENTSVSMTAVSNADSHNGQTLSEVFLLGSDLDTDRAVRVIERYPEGETMRDTYVSNLRGVTAARIEFVDGFVKVYRVDGTEASFSIPSELAVSCQ